uniref:Uncharacterized protein n=1 Tax=Romanomermis culicivorax TaxID=13658 RepID=A0A915KH13_ROMCU
MNTVYKWERLELMCIKSGQQNNMDKTIIHNAPKEYFEHMMSIVNFIKNVRLINEQLVSMTYCQDDDFAEVMDSNLFKIKIILKIEQITDKYISEML